MRVAQKKWLSFLLYDLILREYLTIESRNVFNLCGGTGLFSATCSAKHLVIREGFVSRYSLDTLNLLQTVSFCLVKCQRDNQNRRLQRDVHNSGIQMEKACSCAVGSHDVSAEIQP